MSYCRWSSDNMKSDVYAYESYEGYTVHMQGNILSTQRFFLSGLHKHSKIVM